MQTAFSPSTELILIRLLIQFVVIIASARLVGALFQRLGQVRTMGEIFAGILLGPSLLGWVFPSLFQSIFPAPSPTTPNIIPFFSHIALVLTVFLIGMEFDFREVPKYAKHVLVIAVGALIAPVLSGMAIAHGLWEIAPGESGFLAYSLFVGICVSITAIPIMGRLLMELKLTQTRLGIMGITTGAIKDVMTWFFMVVVIGIARPPLDPSHVVKMMLETALLATFMLTAGRWALARLEARWPVVNGRPNPELLVVILVVLLLNSAATSHIGIFAIFGAFLTGVTLSHRRELSHAVSDRLHDMTIYFFLPLFFTYTGLRADFTKLTPMMCVWIVGIAVVTGLANAIPAGFLSRRAGLDLKEATAFGALINMPGLMILIVLNIGYDLKVLPPLLFSILLAVAMIRNLVVTPILRACMLTPPSGGALSAGLSELNTGITSEVTSPSLTDR